MIEGILNVLIILLFELLLEIIVFVDNFKLWVFFCVILIIVLLLLILKFG